jgi:hypothetical protein
MPAFVASAKNRTRHTSSHLRLARPRAAVPGDVLVAQVTVALGPGFRIHAPRGWVRIGRESFRTRPFLSQVVYYKVVREAEPISYTWRFGASAAAGGILAYRGLDSTHPLRASARIAAGTAVPSPADAVAVLLFGSHRQGLSPPTGLTERYDVYALAGGRSANAEAADNLRRDNLRLSPLTTVARVGTNRGRRLGRIVELNPAPDFSLAASPSTLSGTPGEALSSSIAVGSIGGFANAVNLSVDGLPPGATAVVDPVATSSPGLAVLTLQTAPSTPTGTYAVRVTGASGSLVHSTVVSLALSLPGPTPLPGTALPQPLPVSTAQVYYVTPSGSDANPGSFDQPWKTIQKALSTLRSGETALVRGGTYTENLQMTRAGTATNPISVVASPGERVVLHAASTSENTYPVQITGSYFRLQGFVIENGLGTSDANVYLWGGAHHIELSGNEIRYGQDQGVFADDTTSYLQFLGNRVHDNGLNHVSGQHQSHGFYIEGSHDLLANNVVYNHPYGFGIQLYPANHDTIVVDNTIAASAHSSIVVGGSGGVYNITIRNNILYDDNWGVEMDSTCPTGPVYIDHNVIDAYSVAPIQGGCSSVDTGSGNTFAAPLFRDYASRDLHLQAGSPAVDVGLSDWSMRTDFDGRTRPQGAGPDTGALETLVSGELSVSRA